MNRWTLLFLACLTGSWATEPMDTVQRLGEFRQVDLSRLFAGEILTERGALMDFPNGIAVQSCFAVPLPAAEVARHLQVWDPSPHEVLKVYAFHPVSSPCLSEDFRQFSFAGNQRPVRWLLDKTLATTPTQSSLNLSRTDAATLAGSRLAPVEGWTKLLVARATAFQQRGWAGVAPYEVAGEKTAPAAQLQALLREPTGIAVEFAPILEKIGLAGAASDVTLGGFYYWSLLEADHHATFNLGAMYRLAVGEHYQLADVEYYVSSDYYTTITLFEVWPVTGGTLVWRVDLLAAPVLAVTKGAERLAYGALMAQDIKKEIRCILDDTKSWH